MNCFIISGREDSSWNRRCRETTGHRYVEGLSPAELETIQNCSEDLFGVFMLCFIQFYEAHLWNRSTASLRRPMALWLCILTVELSVLWTEWSARIQWFSNRVGIQDLLSPWNTVGGNKEMSYTVEIWFDWCCTWLELEYSIQGNIFPFAPTVFYWAN